MNFYRRSFIAAFVAAGILPALGHSVLAAQNPTDTINSFYDALVKSMQSSDGVAGRYEILKPAINNIFDIATMTKIVIGPVWTGLPGAKKDEAIETFRKYIITSYASRFKKFTNQHFEVIEAKDAGSKKMLVLSKLIRPGEEDIQFNYLVWPIKDNWRVIDIYLGGAISEMARLRSEFTEVIQRDGIDGLIRDLNGKTEELAKGE